MGFWDPGGWGFGRHPTHFTYGSRAEDAEKILARLEALQESVNDLTGRLEGLTATVSEMYEKLTAALPTDAADLSEAIRTATRLMEATLEMKPLKARTDN